MAPEIRFVIGTKEVGKPFTDEDDTDKLENPLPVTMKPCVFGNFNRLDPSSAMPPETLAAMAECGVREEDVRAMMRDVSAVLDKRSWCCWRWGFCCIFMLVIWWFDMICQQCSCGLTKCCCIMPALAEIEKVVDSHSEKAIEKGYSFTLLASEFGVGIDGGTVQFDAFFLLVRLGSRRAETPVPETMGNKAAD